MIPPIIELFTLAMKIRDRADNHEQQHQEHKSRIMMHSTHQHSRSRGEVRGMIGKVFRPQVFKSVHSPTDHFMFLSIIHVLGEGMI